MESRSGSELDELIRRQILIERVIATCSFNSIGVECLQTGCFYKYLTPMESK